jgi:Acetyltransferase (GNAT) family
VVAIDDADDRVAGFVNMLSDGALTAFIPWLEVLPGYQGRGIGGELMRRILEGTDRFYSVDLVCDATLVPYYARFGMAGASSALLRHPAALESPASSTGRDHPRSARGLASHPKVVGLREFDANLQEIDAEFQALVPELLILVRFAYAEGRSASVQVGVDARSGAIARRSGGRLQRIGAGTGGDGHGNAANVSGRSAGADPRGRAGRRAAGHRAGQLD